MFSFLLIKSFSSIYALDIGNDGIRVGVASNENGVFIQPSSRGTRSTPNVIGILNETRGNETKEKITYGFETIISESRNKSSVQKNPFNYIVNQDRYKLTELHPSVASALLLRSVVPTVSQKDQIIFAVPSASTPHYRSSLHELAQISGFTDVEIIDQSTALASLYIAERVNRTARKQETVLFIEIGVSQIEVTLWKFIPIPNRVNITLLKYHYTDKISGEKIDQLFASYIKSKLSTHIDEEILIKIGKKAKEMLTTDKYAEVFINELNTTINVTRDEAREITKPIITKLREILKDFEAQTVEICGGASRYFAINELSKEIFGNSLRTDFASQDSIALGTAYYSAIKARIAGNMKLFIDRDAIFNYYVNKSGKTVQLLSGGQPYIRKFFNVLEKSKFEFYLNADLPKSLETTVDVETSKLAHGPFTLVSVDGFDKFEGRADKDGKFLLNITLLPTRGYGEYIVTSVTGQRRKMNFDVSERCPDEKRAPSGGIFETMKKEVAIIKANKPLTARSELEMFLADVEERLLYDSDAAYVVKPEEQSSALSYINECRVNMTTMKTKRLRKLLSSSQLKLNEFLIRSDERKERPFAAESLQQAIDHIEKRIPDATSDDTTVNSVKDFIQNAKDYMKMALEVDRYSTPVILAKDLRRKAESVMKKETDLFAGKRASNAQEL